MIEKPDDMMTGDHQTDHLRDRIRYWEGIRDRASIGDHAECRNIAREIASSEGRGPRDHERIRAAIIDRCSKRLDTLYGELGAKMMGRRDWVGLRW
jgi:hypothetical protein